MAGEDEPRPALQGVPDGGQRGANSTVVGHLTVLQWDVEVYPHQNPLPVDGQRVYLAHGHGRRGRHVDQRSMPSMSLVRSTIRELKPHSLSYQLRTLTIWPPLTLVFSASTMELWLLPM